MEAIFFPIVIGLLLVETILSGRWKKIYFEFGIPLFSKSIKLKKIGVEANVIAEDMNNEFKGTGYTSSLYFKLIDKNTIAFREKMFELSLFSYTPIMHGKISLNNHSTTIKVTGLANWFPLIFIFFWYSTLVPNISFERDFIFLFAPAVIVAFIYFIQRNKYIKLCNYLSELKHKI